MQVKHNTLRRYTVIHRWLRQLKQTDTYSSYNIHGNKKLINEQILEHWNKSRDVHPCDLVPRCQVSRFQSPQPVIGRLWFDVQTRLMTISVWVYCRPCAYFNSHVVPVYLGILFYEQSRSRHESRTCDCMLVRRLLAPFGTRIIRLCMGDVYLCDFLMICEKPL